MMGKLNKNTAGFAGLEALLILIIVGLVGFTGYYVWHARQTANKSLTPSQSQTPSFKKATTKAAAGPYSGWKSATLQYERVSYKYPADWSVTDLSSASPKGTGCIYPGDDNIVLTSPSKEQITMHTGMDCFGDGGVLDFGAQPIKALGQNLYLVYENNNVDDGGGPPKSPSFACLAQTTNPTTPFEFKSRNIQADEGSSTPLNYFCYYPYDLNNISQNNGIIPSESEESIKNSKDFASAKLIFESLSY